MTGGIARTVPLGVVSAVTYVADIAFVEYTVINRDGPPQREVYAQARCDGFKQALTRGEQMAAVAEREPVLARDAEAPAIRELDALLARVRPPAAQLIGPEGERLDLPVSVYMLLTRVVHELARGNGVTIMPIHAELTTQQAADLLNVSRPFLVKLLESGEIPFHRVGTHRRIRLEDIVAYRRRRSQAMRSALAEMAREAQDLGLYE